MTVTISKPTGELIGTFEIQGLEELRAAFATFAAHQTVSAYDLVTCGDQTWTVLLKDGHLTLTVGNIPRNTKPNPAVSKAMEQDAITGRVLQRVRESYEQADKTYALGDTIKSISLVLGFLVFAIVFSSNAKFGDMGSRLFGLISGAVAGVLATLPLYALGALLCVQGEILQATLDTSVNTSNFLTDEARSNALKIQNGELR